MYNMKQAIVILFLFLFSSIGHAQTPKGWNEFVNAIRQVETGGMKDNGLGAIGDKGRSYGPYQIQKVYWIDSKVSGSWDRCLNDKAYSESVMLAYFKRYAPKALEAGDWETLARLHNSGPNWKKKTSRTDGYWAKVKKNLEKACK